MRTIEYISKEAAISDCEQYRYILTRVWDDSKESLVFVGLNPSTADADRDDPTIRRCVRFAHDNGYGALIMLNLFAYRSTDPKALITANDPIGPENDEVLREYSKSQTVVAWGNVKGRLAHSRVSQVRWILTPPTYCLGVTKRGYPRHPLYVRADQPLQVYDNVLK